MFTCAEHFDNYHKTKALALPMWVHALDVLKYILRGDISKTIFGDQRPEKEFLAELQTHLDGKPKEVENFIEARHNDFVQERRWRRFDSEHGDLSVDRYLDGERRPCDDYRKKFVDKPAVTLIMDASVPYRDRPLSDMDKRHKQIYSYACEANKEGRPCRVLAVNNCGISELSSKMMRTYFVLKDFDDPIFPSIWAAFETNQMTNSFINAYMDYFIGTSDSGNGRVESFDLSQDRQMLGETILIGPATYVTDREAKR